MQQRTIHTILSHKTQFSRELNFHFFSLCCWTIFEYDETTSLCRKKCDTMHDEGSAGEDSLVIQLVARKESSVVSVLKKQYHPVSMLIFFGVGKIELLMEFEVAQGYF